MSADNYISIKREGKEYVGYMCCASIEDDDYIGTECFRVKTIRQAIKAAQAIHTEYGYRFRDV